MHQIEDIVGSVAGALGPDADPKVVEAVAAALLESNGLDRLFTGGCLHISLTDCSSLLTKTVRSRAYDKIRRIASHATSALRDAAIGGPLYIATTPLTTVAAGASASDLILLARMLDDAATDCSASEITGLAAAAERSVDSAAAALISVIPEVLESTARVSIDIQSASRDDGVNTDAVARTLVAMRRFGDPQKSLLRVRLNSSVRVPASFPCAAFFVRAHAPTLVHAVLSDAPDANLQEIGDILTATAFGVGRDIAKQGEAAAEIMADRSGLNVHFGGIEVDAGTGSPYDRAVESAFAAAITQGFRAATPQAHQLPRRVVWAFTNSTSEAGAGARIVNDLARTGDRGVAATIVFCDNGAGERIQVGPFHDILVEESPDRIWFRRGGRIPFDSSR